MSKLLHWKKCLACLLAFALGAALLCVGAGASAQSAFTLGDGTEDNPYQIQTVDQLKAVADDLDAHYILVADLDLGGESSPWTPIGSFSPYAPFTGTFDGGGHTISGLYINSGGYAGLFGVVGLSGEETEAEVKNLHVDGYVSATMDQAASFYVGGITGFAGKGVEITDCSFSGVVKAESEVSAIAYAGGIVGYNFGTISGCEVVDSTEGPVSEISASSTGYAYAGGIAGYSYGGEMTGCTFSGTVEAENGTIYAGGIAGYAYGDVSNCKVVDSAAGASKISASSAKTVYAGGVAGCAYGVEVTNSSFSGTVEAESTSSKVYAGGISGYHYTGEATGCTFSGTVEGDTKGSVDAYIGGVAGYAYGDVSNCKVVDSAAGASKISAYSAGTAYAGGVAGYLTTYEVTNCTFSGTVEADVEGQGETICAYAGGIVGRNSTSGTISSCKVVDSAAGASEVSASLLRTGEADRADVYAGGIAGQNAKDVTDCSFSGSVSAKGTTDETDVGGIVGRNINGTISNCYTTASGAGESKISAEPSCTHLRIGGIAGYNSGTISGCTNSLAVSSGGDTVNTYIGGIAGSGGTISDCHNTAEVTGGAEDANICTGGIAGSGGTISNCTNSGKVKSVSPEGGMQIDTGGIAGRGSKISNCNNTAEVSSSGGTRDDEKTMTCTGGVVGYGYGTAANIEHCFNTGAVSVSGALNGYTGGVVGYGQASSGVANSFVLQDCYNTGAVTAENCTTKAYTGGVIGFGDGFYNSSDGSFLAIVHNCYNTGTVNGDSVTQAYAGGVVGHGDKAEVKYCHNQGSVSKSGGTGLVGGIVGRCYDSTIAKCYYLDGTAERAVGQQYNTNDDDDVTNKSAEEFASGDIVDLLNHGQAENHWGRADGDNYPVLITSEDTYRVTFMVDGKVTKITDVKPGDKVKPPADPSAAGKIFDGWYTEDGKELGTFEITGDTTFTARFTEDAASLENATIGYSDGTVTADPGYQVSMDGGTWGDSVKVEPGDTIYIKVDGGTAHEVTLPSRPAAPDVEGGEERINGATLGMEYSTDGGANWVRFTEDTLRRVEPGEYLVRYAATSDAFASEYTEVAVKAHSVNMPTAGIDIDQTEGGTVDTNLGNASEGSTITVTVTPDEGYEVGGVTVTGPDGEIPVERVDETTYTFTMPDGPVSIDVTFVPAGGGFTDLAPGAWYTDAVEYVTANGLMEGTSATTFEPESAMTRAMVWAILARIDGETVTGANWVETAREWAMANGVSDGTDPNGNVTREQLATMLWRYAGEPASSYSLSAFTDADSVSGYAATAMAWAVEHGIITGVTDTTLVPQGTATRAQCAAMLMRFVENVK